MNKNIYFFCPDFEKPSGGTKRIYHVVSILVKNGFNAKVLHTKNGFRLSWTEIDVPVCSLEDDTKISNDDILVIPEGLGGLIQKSVNFPCQRIIFAMSIEYIMTAIPEGKTWRDFGIEKAITTTDGVVEFIETTMGVEAYNIGFQVDAERFYYKPEKKKKTIVYLGRPGSNKLEAENIARILYNICPEFKEYKLIELANYSLAEYSEIVREASFFLSLAPRWAANSAITDAMTAGCVICGYSGLGSEAVVENGVNCILAPQGDYLEAARLIRRCIISEEIRRQIITNALKVTETYTLENEEARVVKFFSKLTG